MKTFYQDENNVVLDENNVELKPCINRESKSLEITIKLNSFPVINMKFLVVVTPLSIYHYVYKFNVWWLTSIRVILQTTYNLLMRLIFTMVGAIGVRVSKIIFCIP